MSSLDALENKLINILDEAQNGLQYHKKQLKVLQALYDEWSSSFMDFFETFFSLVQRVLTVLKREPATERLVEFIARFSVATAPKKSKCVEEEDEHDDSSSEEEDDEDKILKNFTHLFLVKLLEFHQAKDKAVRFRVTQITAKTLDYARDDKTIRLNSFILDHLSETLLTLLYDRYVLVRTHAAFALSFFQDTTDVDCPITSALAWSVEHDTSPEVRKCIVSNIILNKNTLSLVIGRTRDTSDAVRRCSFLVLSEKCTIRHLKIGQRLKLLEDGLHDRCEQVKEACLCGLLRSWCLTLEGDIFNLLRRLDVESSSEICEMVLMNLFGNLQDEELLKSFEMMLAVPDGCGEDGTQSDTREKSSEEETKGEGVSPAEQEPSHAMASKSCTVPIENLDSEVAFYWRCLCKYFKNRYNETKDPQALEYLESIIPTLLDFCEYLNSCFSVLNVSLNVEESHDCHMTREFTMAELCGILPSLDFTDEVGRRRLGQLVYTLITSGRFPASLVSPILVEQRAIWPQKSYRVEKLMEIIADIQYPGLSESNNATGETSLSDLSYLDLKDDMPSLLKCLAVTTELFRELSTKKLSPSLQTLVETLLFPCIKNENPYIRDMAINALGLACLFDIELARSHILLFIQVSQVDHESVQATALKVVFDLLHLFGLEAFSQGKEEEGEKRKGGHDDECQKGENGEMEDTMGEQEGEGPNKGVCPSPSGTDHKMDDSSSDTEDKELSETEKTTQKFLHILAQFLDGESLLLRAVAVEGLSKLLLTGRVVSGKLLVRLFLHWYNPAHQNDSLTRSVLGAFFTEYASSEYVCRCHTSECYIPLVRTVLEAPPTSPLCTVDVNNLATFVINLSTPTKPDEDSPHDALSLSVANHLLSGDLADLLWCRTHCKALGMMTLSKTNKSNAMDVLTLLNQLCQVIKDKQSLKSLEKLKMSLLKIVPHPVTTDSSSEGRETSNTRGDIQDGDSDGLEEGDSDKENTEISAPPTPNSDSTQSQTPPIAKTSKDKIVQSSCSRNLSNRRTATKGTSTKQRRTTRKTRGKLVQTAKTTDDREDSDDSLIGEHSPFLRATKSRTKASLPATTVM